MKKILSIFVLVILMVLTTSSTVGATIDIDASASYSSTGDLTVYFFDIITADGGDRDPDGEIVVTLYGDRNRTTKKGVSFPLPQTPPIERGELMNYKVRIVKLGNITGMSVSYMHGHRSSQYDWNVEYIEFEDRRFRVDSTLCNETATIEFYPSGYTVTIKPGANRLPGRYYPSSIFSSPAIWFIIGGGVLILVAGALITISALRKKKAKLALLATNASTVDTPISDSSEDKLDL